MKGTKMNFTKSQQAAMKRVAATATNWNKARKLSPQELRVQQGAVKRDHYL
jgi:hypothetical protein